MSTIKLSKDFMLDEVLDNKEVVIEDNIFENTRWSIIHELIFKHGGKVYQTTYSVGATEMQYEGPWEYDEEVECTEVVAKEVTKVEWVPVS